jgi:hypothetical protein
VVAEGGAGGLDAWRILGLVEWLFGGRDVLFGDDVVDRLCHLFLNATDFIWTTQQAMRSRKSFRS